ncbi:TonB-dependent receptor [Mariniflexile litorale]|uniref:TonB-dependent receptor n=1 Tax=Mariniflexile litorale TaxID=3045158 RepID=A0AAU7EE61_9FLAO|nr:TonB-dependent receptor [Mariniflexile sp. KMM 9835]MDQ8210421.1 TonB-dependent receptor [Mariniflexile sp. KMM 9835]
MIKKLILLTTFLFSAAFIYGQQGDIKGKVISNSGKTIENVNVTIINTSHGTYTNSKGDFYIKDVNAGSYTLAFSYVGYHPEEISITIKNNETTNVPTVKLNEDQEKLNEVLVNGNKTNKYAERKTSSSLRLKGELAKLPQNIQVISSDLLIDQQVTSIMDGVIRNVSGVTMLEHWGNFARVNMRGFRLPAFRNGVNVQDTWGPLSEDMNTVDRIEFVKGPAGFMMSAGEPGGFYNVVTKKPTDTRIAQISLAGGSFDYYRGTVDLGGKLTKDGKLLYRFNGMYQTSDTHRGNEDAQRYGFAPALTYNLSDKTSITTELNVQQAESYLGSAYIFAPVADGYGSLDRDFKYIDNNYPITDIQELTLFTNLKHEFSENWSIETQFAYLRYDQEGNSTWLWNFEDNGDATRYASIWDALSIGKYFQTYLNGNFETFGLKHTVLGGFDFSEKEYWADWSQLIIIDTDQPFNIYNPVYGNTETPVFNRSQKVRNRFDVHNTGFTVRAFYAQDEISFLQNKIRLTLAARHTELVTLGKTETDKKFTPRFGLSVDILPTLTAYALYDQSFLGQTGVSQSGDYFDPVEAKDIEGGIKKSFFNNRLKTSLGVYQITKENVLVTDPENINFSIQLGEIQSKGIEFDMQGEITPELNVVFNYANTNVEITKDTNPDNIGQRVAGHAKHMTNGWVNYTFANTSKLKGFGASLGYQYQIDRSAWAWGADNQSDLPDYFRLDGGLSWKNKKIRIQLNVNNILDEYLYSGSNYGSYLYWQSEPGINGRLTVTYKF